MAVQVVTVPVNAALKDNVPTVFAANLSLQQKVEEGVVAGVEAGVEARAEARAEDIRSELFLATLEVRLKIAL